MDRHVLADRDLEFPRPRATAGEIELGAVDLEGRIERHRAGRTAQRHDPDRHGQPSRDAANRQVAGYGQSAVPSCATAVLTKCIVGCLATSKNSSERRRSSCFTLSRFTLSVYTVRSTCVAAGFEGSYRCHP